MPFDKNNARVFFGRAGGSRNGVERWSGPTICPMSVSAKQLSKSGAKGKDLEGVVREQLAIIDDRLLKKDRTWGRNILSYELPTNFVFPGLDKKSAQRIIYCAIIRSLIDRGFGVRILLEEGQTLVFVEWVTDLNKAEVDAMNDLIRKTKIERKNLKQFLSLKTGKKSRGSSSNGFANQTSRRT